MITVCIFEQFLNQKLNLWPVVFQRGGEEDEVDQDEDIETPLPNLMELVYYFEQANIGLNREEMIRIWLSLKNLVDNHPLQHVRFWGKLLGTQQNYIIAEVEYRDGEEGAEEEEEEVQKQKHFPTVIHVFHVCLFCCED